ncbi:MAG: AAA domain-containing protein [Gallionella sp.]
MSNRIEAARQKLTQLFNFFKAVEQRRAPIVRHIANQPWTLRLSDLPTHETLRLLRPVPEDGTWLIFRKPETHPCPDPEDHLRPWLNAGWENPELSDVSHKTERVDYVGDEPNTISFESQSGLNFGFLNWKAKRNLWKASECPARAALKIWERFFALHSQLEREGEAWELVLGEGLFNWKRPVGDLHHPILLQRVELSFDPQNREFRVSNIEVPPELYSALFSDDECAGLPIKHWQEEIGQGELHPLGGDGVTDWLKGVIGSFRDGELIEGEPALVEVFPRIGRAPVLFLRKRQAGRIQFIEEILADLPTATELPSSLLHIVGCAPEIEPNESDSESDTAYANEDEDILLSKPANAAQLAILKRLAHQDGVLVQGPPGTGKTHTIANLIGSLLAEGKSVLVTSHTTKALRVLREHVAEPLRSLCVSVLDSDTISRKEREIAVRELAVRLGESRQSFVQQSNHFTGKRHLILTELRAARSDLAMAINGEYRSLILAGEEIEPARAAREVADGEGRHDWIPGSVDTGKPLPLNESELKALYVSNQQLACADEIELSKPLPKLDELWSPEEFLKRVNEFSELAASDLDCRSELWKKERLEQSDLESLLEHISRAVDYLGQSENEAWRLAVIQAGMEGGQAAKIWQLLCRDVESVREQASKAAEPIYRYDPQLADGWSLEEQHDVLQEIIQHLNQGKAISFITLLLKPKWKELIDLSLVDANKPARLEHFQALLSLAELALARGSLIGWWARQMVPHGVPDLKQITNLQPEEFAFQLIPQIRTALAWHTHAWAPLESDLIGQGLRWMALVDDAPPAQTLHHRAERLRFVVREKLPDVIAAEVRRRRLEHLKMSFAKLEAELQRMDRLASSSSIVVRNLKRAVEAKAVDDYRDTFLRLEQLHQLLPIYQKRMAWLKRLRVTAPDWADAIERRLMRHDGETMLGSPLPAWRWRQFTQELDCRAALSVPEIQARIERLGNELRNVTVSLVEQRAWASLLGKVSSSQRQALLGWVATMKKIGAGTGRTVPALLRQARHEMEQARGAVPVWIMPFSQVTSSFHPVRDRFDVLIVDEASQEGVLGLMPFYMAKKVIVVGDDEQVTPLDVGGEQQPIQDLIGQWLDGLPSVLLFDLKTSIYDRAQIAFGSAVRLKEHFRCVPEIIQFSNHLSYKGEIRPLRESASTPIKPALVAHRVNGSKVGKKNLAEAETIASLIAAAVVQPEYAGKTFGVISLVGDEQADEIDKMLRTRLDPVVYENRRILCGNPAQFQGDERDVIFLSVIDSKEEGEGPLGLRQDGQDGMWKKRYNVAASRAKDQLWVVYSLDYQTQLKPGDLRRRLIEHALNPNALMQSLADGVENTESPFEAEVYRLLVGQNYRVRTQYEVGAYRIDLVVEGGGKRLAIECDGDRWHYDKVEEDLARQALLERLGWRFVRIRGSVFYRDKSTNREEAMSPVFERLQQMCIAPEEEIVPDNNTGANDGQQLECVKQRAAALLHEWKDQ